MAQHIVALDIGTTAARVAVISATFRQATLLGVDDVPIAPGTSTAEVLEAVRARIGFPIDSLICSVDARRTSVRNLRFPFNDLKRVAPAVQFELDGQIPYDLNTVMVVWHVIERDQRNTDVLAGIAPRSMLAEQLAQLTEHGLEPRAIVHPSAALAELMPPDRGDDGAVATLCIGEQQTHVCISRKGLRAARTLHMGGAHLDASIASQLNISIEEAHALKEGTAMLLDLGEVDAASEEDKKLHQAMVVALAPLLTHVSATFKGAERDDRPSELLVTGGGSRLAGLSHYLSQRLALEVRDLDVGAALGLLAIPDKTAVNPEHAVVLGLALGMFRRGQDIPMNFRHGELAYHGDIQLYRGFFTRLAVGFAFVFLAAFGHAALRYAMLQGEEAELNRGFGNATRAIVGTEIKDPAKALAAMRQSGAEGATVIPPFSASAMLEMVPKSLPSTVDASFSEIDVRVDGVVGQPERITAHGEAASFETIEQLVGLLKRDPCVQDAEVSQQHKGNNAGRVEFVLGVKVSCPVGTQPGSVKVAAAGEAP